jgi:hypothetical protein
LSRRSGRFYRVSRAITAKAISFTVVAVGLSMAEQCIDARTKTETFRGRQIELVTGRVLLHALDDRGEAVCGQDKASLTPTGRPWDAGYLPHLLRCPGCLGEPFAGFFAGLDTTVEIRTAHGSDVEEAGAAALRAILDQYDLRRWLFTDLVTVDEQQRGAISILGPAAAAQELRQHRGYSWIYGQILASPDWFAEFLRRHGLRIPSEPPLPRRCFGDMPWMPS